MWDYLVQERRDEYHRGAAAQRLVRQARVQRPPRIAQWWSALRGYLILRLQAQENRTIYPKVQAQEMHTCVDA